MASAKRAGAIGLLLSLALVWAVTWGVQTWKARAALAKARDAVGRGRYREAAPLLSRLAAQGAGGGEAALLLGDCEAAMGHPDAALAAWALVTKGSAPAGPAALRRGRLAIERGRFTEAEEALVAAIGDDKTAAEAREALIRLLWRQGRFVEVAARIEEQWSQLRHAGRLSVPKALDLLRGHLSLGLETFPVDLVEADLRRAAGSSPDDVRVSLARVRWAMRAGRLYEAEEWLDACLSRCPDDVETWVARLEWARAAGRVDEVRRASAHIPAARFSAVRVLGLRAWLASLRGDSAAERAALERLVALDPGDIAALNRLAELLFHASEPAPAARIRSRATELSDAKHRYRSLFKDDALATRAAEMSRLAMTLGRRFESGAFSNLAALQGTGTDAAPVAPDRAEASDPLDPPLGSDATLADRLAPDLAPIPAGAGSVAESSVVPRFEDDAGAAGLSFIFQSGATPAHHLPETMSGGVGLLDYDGDGWLDVFFLQGGHFPPESDRPANGDRLFRNRGDGSFEDATVRSRLGSQGGGYGHGVAVGDYDNDGHPDLFVTRWRAYALYHNRGDGSFEDVTARAGLDGDRDWPTSAAFADLDGDGDLDLYVCHYLRWDADHPRRCPSPSGWGLQYCDPRYFEAMPDHVFRNDNGRFVDVTREAGLDDRDGRGLGVVAADFDDDGRIDLFVANDGTANHLLHNRGGFRFEEVGHAAGVAAGAGGNYQAGMGIACGDLTGDGRPDLFVTNFYGESTTFFRNLGRGIFSDQTSAVGLAAPSRSLLGFGILLSDVNNDGRPDLMTANGHVNDGRPHFPYAMPAQILLGGPRGRLTDVSSGSGAPWSIPRLGRGLAGGDLDNDGRPDLVLVALDAPAAYFHNRTPGGHFVTFALEGTMSNRDGVGAVVTVTAGGRRRRAWRSGGGSYQSASDPRLHFGLGRDRIEEAEVRWPSGCIDRFANVEPDHFYRLKEGATAPIALPGLHR